MNYAITIDETSILEALRVGWSWALVEPAQVIKISAFGNVITKLADGSCWRICPEDLHVEKLADDEASLSSLFASPEFVEDWDVHVWVEQAEAKLGQLKDNQCYGFKIWPLLNHDYSPDNMVIKNLVEWLRASGDIANQIKDVPDGAPIRLVIENSTEL